MDYHSKNKPGKEPKKMPVDKKVVSSFGAEFKKIDCLRPYLHHNDDGAARKKVLSLETLLDTNPEDWLTRQSFFNFSAGAHL